MTKTLNLNLANLKFSKKIRNYRKVTVIFQISFMYKISWYCCETQPQ